VGNYYILPVSQFFNLFVSNVYIGLGTDLANIEDNKLFIYTHNDLKYNIDDTEESNNKEINLIWYNKDADGNYVGFSDGKISTDNSGNILDYDEKDYLEKSKQNNRMMAQKGRKGVPDDVLGLSLSADLDELKNLLPKLKKAVS
jgi:hypothetical protein